MKKLVIYTCVTGSYDRIERPSVQVPWADWVCFSTEEFKDELWPVSYTHLTLPTKA